MSSCSIPNEPIDLILKDTPVFAMTFYSVVEVFGYIFYTNQERSSMGRSVLKMKNTHLRVISRSRWGQVGISSVKLNSLLNFVLRYTWFHIITLLKRLQNHQKSSSDGNLQKITVVPHVTKLTKFDRIHLALKL